MAFLKSIVGGGGGSSKVMEQLMTAVRANDLAGISQLVEKNKLQKPQLNSALHEAVQTPGCIASINKLLELGADLTSLVDDPFKKGVAGYVGGKQTNVLHKAALAGQADVFMLLLDKGVAAVSLIDQKCCLLKDNGSTEEAVTPMFCVIVGSFSDEMQRAQCGNKLLSYNKINLENTFGEDKNTTLLLALLYGRNTLAQFLIANRANIQARNRLGKGVWHMFAKAHARLVATHAVKNLNDLRNVHNFAERETEIAAMFVRMGADVHSADNEGNTGLHDAAWEYSYIFHDLAMKISYTDHMECFHKTTTCKVFVMNRYNIATKNKKGDTADDVIQRGHGYRAHEFEKKDPNAKTKKK